MYQCVPVAMRIPGEFRWMKVGLGYLERYVNYLISCSGIVYTILEFRLFFGKVLTICKEVKVGKVISPYRRFPSQLTGGSSPHLLCNEFQRSDLMIGYFTRIRF